MPSSEDSLIGTSLGASDKIVLYDFEEIEEQSVQTKKRLFITDFLDKNEQLSEDEDASGLFAKFLHIITTLYLGRFVLDFLLTRAFSVYKSRF